MNTEDNKEKENQKHHHQHQVGSVVTVFGLVNGMFGGGSMVAPLVGIQTGYITIIFVCCTIGFVSHYTASLIIRHLGKCKNVTNCFLRHFDYDHRYMTAYSFILWLSTTPTLIIYFKIICLQVEGLIGNHSKWIAPLVCLFLIIVIILIRIFHFGSHTLAIGCISIAFYLIFFIWAQITAPQGPKQVPAFGNPLILASTIIAACSIQDVLVQNITRHADRENYSTIVKATYSIGILSYIIISLGSIAIVNRKPYRSHPEIVSEYFSPQKWQVAALEIIYLIRFCSAMPNFLIVNKTRFFHIFKRELNTTTKWYQIVYIIIAVAICYIIYVSEVKLVLLLSIKGAMLGYVYIIIAPIVIHFKCIFGKKNSGFQIMGIQNDESTKSLSSNTCDCQCNNSYSSEWTFMAETLFLCLVLIMGFCLMVFALIHNFSHH